MDDSQAESIDNAAKLRMVERRVESVESLGDTEEAGHSGAQGKLWVTCQYTD